MGFNVKHIKKYFRWFKTMRKNYRYDKKNLSIELAKINKQLAWAQLKKNEEDIIKCANRKHEWILRFVESKCPKTIEKYKNIKAPENLYTPQKEVKVWSMWWQGEEKADKLFRMCIESARKHTGKEVVVLSKDNFSKYIHIPENMLNKLAEGKIALQHICDYMVVAVLAEQGGFFTGATVYWSQDKNEDFLKTPFFTCKADSGNPIHISGSRWVGYLLAGNKEFPLFGFMKDALAEYWENDDKAIDYLFMDYMIEFAYRTIPCVKEVIDALPSNNMLRNELIEVLGDTFDGEKFKRFTDGDTFLYKLSWKFGNKNTVDANGNLTNYGYMLKDVGVE